MSELGSVSVLSIICMAVSVLLAFFVPFIVIVLLGIRKKLNWKALLFGALMFIVFALILEQIMHVLVLGKDPTQSVVYKNTIFYMLYGGFAAGIFEETARLLCFKYILRAKNDEKISTGISYGLGHGGIEAILIGGMAAISNLITSFMLNSGLLKGVSATMSGTQLDTFKDGINSLVSAPSYMFLASGVERMSALLLQIALSLFVFKAVVDKKWLYFVYAILIHAGIDMFAVLFTKSVIKDIFILEGIVMLVSIVVAVIAYKINRKTPAPEQSVLG